jgi:hypothetical protein
LFFQLYPYLVNSRTGQGRQNLFSKLMKRYNTFVSRLGAGFIDGLAPESQPA